MKLDKEEIRRVTFNFTTIYEAVAHLCIFDFLYLPPAQNRSNLPVALLKTHPLWRISRPLIFSL